MRIALSATALVLLLALQTPAQEPRRALVDFDVEGDVATGPYTLMVFEGSRGSVSLTTSYRFGGYRAVEIRDVAGDGEFAELQGYFPEQIDGELFVRFAFMTAEVVEPFNIAFAGPAHFAMTEDGFGFWLRAEGGTLFHISAGNQRKLFDLASFTWYVAELRYDVTAGSYDLKVSEEGRDEPRASATDQPNATGLPGSTLDRFSFIGDPPGRDRSNARLYIDDLLIATDRAVRQGPFVAPRSLSRTSATSPVTDGECRFGYSDSQAGMTRAEAATTAVRRCK